MPTSSRIEAAKHAVMAQTDLLHREFGRVESRWKGDGTRVTAVDVAISENIFSELRRQFPDDQYLSEESAGLSAPTPVTARFSWVLDPIDGTNNYALGLPYCAISLALVESGEPIYGVIYDFTRRTLMHGGPGFGAWDGDRSVRAISTEPHRESVVGLHSPSDKSLASVPALVMEQFKIRALGTATLHLAYVAAGLFDGAADFNVKIWDLAAAIPLCRAAGAEVRFFNGEQLPIRVFDLKMARIIYAAGAAPMCGRLDAMIRPCIRAAAPDRALVP
jgi:myo-inositol-1(or 4)-monophosphatase